MFIVADFLSTTGSSLAGANTTEKSNIDDGFERISIYPVGGYAEKSHLSEREKSSALSASQNMICDCIHTTVGRCLGAFIATKITSALVTSAQLAFYSFASLVHKILCFMILASDASEDHLTANHVVLLLFIVHGLCCYSSTGVLVKLKFMYPCTTATVPQLDVSKPRLYEGFCLSMAVAGMRYLTIAYSGGYGEFNLFAGLSYDPITKANPWSLVNKANIWSLVKLCACGDFR